MNQGRIWCVVNPTVGWPLFLGSVALTSLCVHYTVLTHTTWMGAFFEGGKSKKASLEETVSPVALNAKAVPGYVISVAPVSAENARAGSSSRSRPFLRKLRRRPKTRRVTRRTRCR